MIEMSIKKLVQYGRTTGLIEAEDEIYARNQILEVLKMSEYEEPGEITDEISLEDTLNALTDYAAEQGILENNSVVYRDLFDTRLMNCLMPRPSEVVKKFRGEYEKSPEDATAYFYKLSQDSDYIRRYRVCKDLKWITKTEYGDLDITVNLSKPEKDPKAIAERISEMPALYGKRGLRGPNQPSGEKQPPDHSADLKRRVLGLPVFPVRLL